jgi:SAM-dependent methyltransferase
MTVTFCSREGRAGRLRPASSELARLADVVARVRRGQPWLVTIEGESGVGKTALATEDGLDITYEVGDVEDVPHPDASFDTVSSAMGVIAAPDNGAVARELARVCKPGGRIGLAARRPDGDMGGQFALLAKYLPPPPEGVARWPDRRAHWRVAATVLAVRPRSARRQSRVSSGSRLVRDPDSTDARVMAKMAKMAKCDVRL